MAIISPWTLGYKTRRWKVHEGVSNIDKPWVTDNRNYEICDSDSPKAFDEPLYGPCSRFYADLEWIAADVDTKNFGGRIGRLETDCRGHKACERGMILYNDLPSREMMMRMNAEELGRSCRYTVAVEVIE